MWFMGAYAKSDFEQATEQSTLIFRGLARAARLCAAREKRSTRFAGTGGERTEHAAAQLPAREAAVLRVGDAFDTVCSSTREAEEKG
jgi:hypothetical protein